MLQSRVLRLLSNERSHGTDKRLHSSMSCVSMCSFALVFVSIRACEQVHDVHASLSLMLTRGDEIAAMAQKVKAFDKSEDDLQNAESEEDAFARSWRGPCCFCTHHVLHNETGQRIVSIPADADDWQSLFDAVNEQVHNLIQPGVLGASNESVHNCAFFLFIDKGNLTRLNKVSDYPILIIPTFLDLRTAAQYAVNFGFVPIVSGDELARMGFPASRFAEVRVQITNEVVKLSWQIYSPVP